MCPFTNVTGDLGKQGGNLDLVHFGCSMSKFTWFSPQQWNFPVQEHFTSVAIAGWNQLKLV